MDCMFIKTKLPPNSISAHNRQCGFLWEPDWINIHNDDELYARVRENGRAVIIVGFDLMGDPQTLSPAEFERLWQGH